MAIVRRHADTLRRYGVTNSKIDTEVEALRAHLFDAAGLAGPGSDVRSAKS
jgi:hypothetical protein